jgi:hypothetical protein
MSDKTVWRPIITFSDEELNRAPLICQDDDRIPVFDDPRGGVLAVAEVVEDAPKVAGEIASLRFGVVDKNGTTAIVLDGYQVAILINAMRDWLDREVPA